MRKLHHFAVTPRLPAALEPLRELAYNLHFAWSRDTRDLFAQVDPNLWAATHENPVELLARVSQDRLDKLASDDAFTSDALATEDAAASDASAVDAAAQDAALDAASAEDAAIDAR